LRPFRLGAFQLAASSGLGVSPVALAGTRAVLRDGSWLPRSGTVRITFEPVLAPTGKEWTDVLRLRDLSRSAILRHCGETDLEPGAR
jgi:1-acyl-sn-glycerol-3-phosphate acyltransferase